MTSTTEQGLQQAKWDQELRETRRRLEQSRQLQPDQAWGVVTAMAAGAALLAACIAFGMVFRW